MAVKNYAPVIKQLVGDLYKTRSLIQINRINQERLKDLASIGKKYVRKLEENLRKLPVDQQSSIYNAFLFGMFDGYKDIEIYKKNVEEEFLPIYGIGNKLEKFIINSGRDKDGDPLFMRTKQGFVSIELELEGIIIDELKRVKESLSSEFANCK